MFDTKNKETKEETFQSPCCHDDCDNQHYFFDNNHTWTVSTGVISSGLGGSTTTVLLFILCHCPLSE